MHNDSITIVVAGKPYMCKPNFQAASIIENILNKSIKDVPAEVGSLSIRAIFAVLKGAIHGNGMYIDEHLLGDAIIVDFQSVEMPLIKSAINYIAAFFPQMEVGDGAKKQEAQTIG